MKPSFDFIKSILSAIDVEGLIAGGAPSDEYDAEAAEMATKLNGTADPHMTLDVILEFLTSTWSSSFELDESDIQKRMPDLKKAATEIFAIINNER